MYNFHYDVMNPKVSRQPHNDLKRRLPLILNSNMICTQPWSLSTFYSICLDYPKRHQYYDLTDMEPLKVKDQTNS